jgi:hypothetical protein
MKDTMSLRGLSASLLSSLLLVSAIATPTLAGSSTTTKVIDDDGYAAVTANGHPDCAGRSTPETDPRIFYSIQGAVYAATPGDDIYVCPGEYSESVYVDRPVRLLGPYAGVSAGNCPARDLASEATITGDLPFRPALTLSATGIVVDGLRFANVPAEGLLTSGDSSGYTIANNTFTGNWAGLALGSTGLFQTHVNDNCFDSNNGGTLDFDYGIVNWERFGNAIIADNRFRNHNGAAIFLTGSNGRVSGIAIRHNVSTDDGSFVDLQAIGHTLVSGNKIRGNSPVPRAAIGIHGNSWFIMVRDNRIASNHTAGVSVADTAMHVQIRRNNIKDTDNGIAITTDRAPDSGGGAVIVSNNRVSDVTDTGLWASSITRGNVFTKNVLSGNASVQCRDDSVGQRTARTANTWIDNDMPSSGVEMPAGICN